MSTVDIQPVLRNGFSEDNGDVCCSSDVEEGVITKRNGLCVGPQHSAACLEEVGKLREELANVLRNSENKSQQLEDISARAALQKEVDRTRIRDLTSANEDLKEQLRAGSSESEQRGRELDSVRKQLISQSAQSVDELTSLREEMQLLRNRLGEKEVAWEKERSDAEEERHRLSGLVAEAENKLSTLKAEHEKHLEVVRSEREARVQQLSEQCAEVEVDKTSLLERLNEQEVERQTLSAHKMKTERTMQQVKQEAERHRSKVQSLESDVVKWQTNYESLQALLTDTQKEAEKCKEDLKSQFMKVSWAQNKLKAEAESHKETKTKLQVVVSKLKESQEELKQQRARCEQLVQKQKELAAQSSSDFDAQLKKRQAEFDQQERELAEAHDAHTLTTQELERVKDKLKETGDQVEQLQLKLEEKTQQCEQVEHVSAEQQHHIETLEEQNKSYRAQIDELCTIKDSFEREQENVSSLSAQLSDESATRSELQDELAELQAKEGEHLSFHQRLSSRNAELQAQHSHMLDRVNELSEETRQVVAERDKLLLERNSLSTALQNLQQCSRAEVESLTNQLADKTKAVEQLSVLLEDERGEVRVLKRKNLASVKDLTRQLLQARKTISSIESGEVDVKELRQRRHPSSPTPEQRTRPTTFTRSPSVPDLTLASSEVSLDDGGGGRFPPNFLPIVSRQCTSPDQSVTTPLLRNQSDVAIAKPMATIEKERRMMLTKIGNLQKAHASKDEKLEFLESHIQELTEEVRRKSKVVQSLLLRQDASSVVPPSFDAYKMHQAPQKGIMASVFHSRRADQRLTLDLSLEINTKMQAVLEDLLLKNITLKDNLATLGEEVAHLMSTLKKHGVHMPLRRLAS